MSITVKALWSAFGNLQHDDIVKITGRNDFKKSDTISLSRIAGYNGTSANDISIWAAKNEGESYTRLLDDSQKVKISQAAGLKETNSNNNSKMSMNKSIFDVSSKKEKSLPLG